MKTTSPSRGSRTSSAGSRTRSSTAASRSPPSWKDADPASHSSYAPPEKRRPPVAPARSQSSISGCSLVGGRGSRRNGSQHRGQDADQSSDALKRAQVIMAARYRSATRSSSLHGQTGISHMERVQSRVALSEGEAMMIQRMIEQEHHQQEVLRRAVKRRQEVLNRIAAMHREKQERINAMEKENAARQEELRRRRRASVSARMQKYHYQRQAEMEKREEKIKERLSHVDAVYYDPFALIAVRERYRSPPAVAEEVLPLKPYKSMAKGEVEKGGGRRSVSRKKLPRRWR